ncbi:MAG: hypothetical protein V4507_02150 [Verrucomicrobiota bacterium]
MNTTQRSLLTVCITGTLFCSFVTSSFAEGEWAKDHPRRAEVNRRLKNQDRRIHQEVKNGEITKDQAKQLHQEDHQIRQEERDMAKQNGGHITKEEKKTLNQQENGVSKQIGK